ncbi:MAG: hypothetical protein ACKVP0_13190 [Pirellulaceae bacterium]
MKLHLQFIAFLTFAALLVAPASLWGQAAKPKLEDELVDDLLKDLPKAEAPAKSKTVKPAKPATKEEAEKKLLQDLQGGEDIGAPPENPLARIGEKMRVSQEKIAGRNTSAETQTTQKEILADLSKLIEQTKKQCSGGGKGKPDGGKSSAKAGAGTGDVRPGPAKEATDRVGKSEREDAEAADVKDMLRRIWGHLPEKMRDQMQAQLSEQFLPKYEKLIEEYYKRLAEERTDK